MAAPGDRLTWLGHATVALEIGGARLITDPVLGQRLLHLRRHAAPPPAAALREIDAVLLSHLHHDHLHLASLRRIGRGVQIVAPAGSARTLTRAGFPRVTEVEAGQELTVSGVPVTVVPAIHDDRRHPRGARADPVGYLIGEAPAVYFGGDTELFDGMARLAGRIGVALLGIWGWGPSLGPGHMDPGQAAQALTMLRPAMVVPIHWGTLFPIGLSRFRGQTLVRPPLAFARAASHTAPDVQVRILRPNEGLPLAQVPAPPAPAGERHCSPGDSAARLGSDRSEV